MIFIYIWNLNDNENSNILFSTINITKHSIKKERKDLSRIRIQINLNKPNKTSVETLPGSYEIYIVIKNTNIILPNLPFVHNIIKSWYICKIWNYTNNVSWSWLRGIRNQQWKKFKNFINPWEKMLNSNCQRCQNTIIMS